MDDSGGGGLFRSGADASPSRASQLAQEFKTLALFHVAIAGSIYIGTTVASRLLLFLFGENAGLCLVVLAVPGWCWQQVSSRPQAGLEATIK